MRRVLFNTCCLASLVFPHALPVMASPPRVAADAADVSANLAISEDGQYAAKLLPIEERVLKLTGRTWVGDRELWSNGRLFVGWMEYNYDPASGELVTVSGTLGHSQTHKTQYRLDKAKQEFHAEVAFGPWFYAYHIRPVEPDGLSFEGYRVKNGKKKGDSSTSISTLQPDGSLRTTTRSDVAAANGTEKWTPLRRSDLPELIAAVRAREASAARSAAEAKREQSEARWRTFNAILQGLSNASIDIAEQDSRQSEQVASHNETMARIRADADRERLASGGSGDGAPQVAVSPTRGVSPAQVGSSAELKGPTSQSPNQDCRFETVTQRLIACGIGQVDCDTSFQPSEAEATAQVSSVAGSICSAATGDTGHVVERIRCEEGSVGLTRMHRCAATITCSKQKRICSSGTGTSRQ